MRKVLSDTTYEKPMTPNRVIDESSAMSWQMKKSVLVSDGVRRLLRCNINTPWPELKHHLQKYCWKMSNSGYPINQIKFIINQTLSKYNKMIINHENGIAPLHRDREWKKKERDEAKEKNKEEWCQGKEHKYDAPLFVPWTPNSEFRNTCQDIVDGLGLRVTVIEKTGQKIKSVLQKSSIGNNKGCPEICDICRDQKNKISCLTPDVTYQIICKRCEELRKKALYDGETTRMAKTRIAEHVENLKKKEQDSPLWEHAQIHHQGVIPNYEYKITGSYLKNPLQRQLMEAVMIDKGDVDIRMNSKAEWILPMAVTLRQERGCF